MNGNIEALCSLPVRSLRSTAALGLTALGLTALTTLATPAFALSLTGATLFSADSTGANAPPDVWNTNSGDAIYNLWFQQAGAFINGPTDAQTGIDIPLTSGAYTYNIYGAPGAVTAFDGVNLFFNGSSTPSISAFGPEQTGSTPSTFAADGAITVGPQNFDTTPGANAIAFTDGGSTVSLTGFTWATPSVYNIDNVGDFTTTPSGANNFVGSLTLNVTSPNGVPAVPEPSSLALLGLALPALGLMVRRRARK